MARNTRIYEVPVKVQFSGDTAASKTFLIDAPSQQAARQYVAAKFVGEATVADGKRIAELVKAGTEVETAKAE